MGWINFLKTLKKYLDVANVFSRKKINHLRIDQMWPGQFEKFKNNINNHKKKHNLTEKISGQYFF